MKNICDSYSILCKDFGSWSCVTLGWCSQIIGKGYEVHCMGNDRLSERHCTSAWNVPLKSSSFLLHGFIKGVFRGIQWTFWFFPTCICCSLCIELCATHDSLSLVYFLLSFM